MHCPLLDHSSQVFILSTHAPILGAVASATELCELQCASLYSRIAELIPSIVSITDFRPRDAASPPSTASLTSAHDSVDANGGLCSPSSHAITSSFFTQCLSNLYVGFIPFLHSPTPLAYSFRPAPSDTHMYIEIP